MNEELKPCPRCGAKNSHAIYAYTEKVAANDRTNYVRFVGIRCDDCGFSLDGYLDIDEAVTMWNAVERGDGMSRTDCCGDCGWCKPSIIRFCSNYNKHWIAVNGILVKCPYCGAVQYRSYKCKECKREVRE